MKEQSHIHCNISYIKRPLLVALGGNLPFRGRPAAVTLEHALARFPNFGIRIVSRSPWYASKPVPVSDQPDFVNGVAIVETNLDPAPLLAALHEIEREFGRVRRERNAARTIDLDLLVYGDCVTGGGEGDLTLPHPRLAERAFVLLPLRDVAPDWKHPVTGETVAEMIDRLPRPLGTKRLES